LKENLLKIKIKNGKVSFLNGDKYEGGLEDYNMHGEGVITYYNGDVYKGSFYDNNKNGSGYYQFNNGDTYEGEFLHDNMHGIGTYFSYSQNSTFRGLFINGKCSNGNLEINDNDNEDLHNLSRCDTTDSLVVM